MKKQGTMRRMDNCLIRTFGSTRKMVNTKQEYSVNLSKEDGIETIGDRPIDKMHISQCITDQRHIDFLIDFLKKVKITQVDELPPRT